MIWNPDEVRPIDIGKRLDGEPDAKQNYRPPRGHDGPVRSVSFSPNGQLVLSSSEDNTVRIWDAAAGKSHDGTSGTWPRGSGVRVLARWPMGAFRR